MLDALSAVERIDQHAILLRDEAAPHLARAGELVVVGIELLVQDQKPTDLRVDEAALGGQLGVHLLDALADERVHVGLCREIGVA